VYVLCCTLGVGICVLLYVECRCMHCVDLYTIVWVYVCDVHYMYVYMVEEKVLGACWVWKLIQRV